MDNNLLRSTLSLTPDEKALLAAMSYILNNISSHETFDVSGIASILTIKTMRASPDHKKGRPRQPNNVTHHARYRVLYPSSRMIRFAQSIIPKYGSFSLRNLLQEILSMQNQGCRIGHPPNDIFFSASIFFIFIFLLLRH